MIVNALANDFTPNQLDDLAYLLWSASREAPEAPLTWAADRLWDAKNMAVSKVPS